MTDDWTWMTTLANNNTAKQLTTVISVHRGLHWVARQTTRQIRQTDRHVLWAEATFESWPWTVDIAGSWWSSQVPLVCVELMQETLSQWANNGPSIVHRPAQWDLNLWLHRHNLLKSVTVQTTHYSIPSSYQHFSYITKWHLKIWMLTYNSF